SSTTTLYPAALEKSTSFEDWLKMVLIMRICGRLSSNAVLSSSLPPNFKDPEAPLISFVVGNIAIKKALLDLGASINILPASLVDNFVNSPTMNKCYQVDVIDEEVQKHAPRTLKDDPLELYLTDKNEEILDIAEVQEIQECLTIADLKGINPSLCMHRIVTDPDVKPSRDAQRRLNPNMKDVVKKEVLKWLDSGIIYPISDSKWVSPTQTVPKKAGITVLETKSGEKLTTDQ
nr:putative reverse transcriptase domain, zinc finger, CCHC-type, retrotransposon Gag domain protein [Tanacetum cinerariifolium]